MLEQHGVELIGADAEAIATAEDREQFKVAMVEIGLGVPKSRSGGDHSRELRGAEGSGRGRGDAPRPTRSIAEIGLPVIVRPAYILGGKGTGIASTPEEFERIASQRPRRQPDQRDPDRGVDQGLEGVRARGHARPRRQLRRGLRHRERRPDGCPHRRLDHRRAGPDPLTDVEYQKMRDAPFACMRRVGVETGGSNVQFARRSRPPGARSSSR